MSVENLPHSLANDLKNQYFPEYMLDQWVKNTYHLTSQRDRQYYFNPVEVYSVF